MNSLLFDAQRLEFLQTLGEAQLLRELLALIHSDGGQYIQEHGLYKAVFDAEIKILSERNA